MKKINSEDIINKVCDLCGDVNFNLPQDIVDCIASHIKNDNSISDNILYEILENAKIASSKKIALCQDTGTANFFVKIGRNCCRVYVHLAYDDGQVARNPDGLG